MTKPTNSARPDLAPGTGRVLVTGASGHLGANLVERLLADGECVRVLLQPGFDNAAVDGLDVERAEGDFRDPAAVDVAMKGCQRVYHCGAMISTIRGNAEHRREIFESNVLGTRHILEAAHAHGVAHRDIKPSNIFLVGGRISEAKLLDFGLAHLGRGMRVVTRSGVIVGTPGYMSPEQARTDRNVDVRTDVFSLGCVLFECLTGRPAFESDQLLAILAKILFAEVPHPRELNPDVPPGLDDLVPTFTQALAQRPSHEVFVVHDQHFASGHALVSPGNAHYSANYANRTAPFPRQAGVRPAIFKVWATCLPQTTFEVRRPPWRWLPGPASWSFSASASGRIPPTSAIRISWVRWRLRPR